MRIGITGITGLIAKKLATLCQAHGHSVTGYSRKPGKPSPGCDQMRLLSLSQPVDLSGIDAVIHLAGEPVIGLWTAEKRRRIVASRRDTTRHLISAIRENNPSIFLCASGTGFYGNRGPEKLEETAGNGHGFLAEVAHVWESEAQAATALGSRVCQVRTGMVLAKNGGAFPLLRRVFSLGLGGKMGNGQQFMPWIHLDDIAALYLHCLETPQLSGPINAVAPQETTNLAFTEALAHALHRPALFGIPRFVLQTALGDLSEIILDSQRAIPRQAIATHFRYAFPNLATALAELV